MLSIINTIALIGMEGTVIKVQVDTSAGIPNWNMVGMLGTSIKEAKERISIAIKNTGIKLVGKKISINLAPAEIRKEGSSFDLAIAVGILCNLGIINKKNIYNSIFIGEISYDGNINPINGILPMCLTAKEKGFKKIYIPIQNKEETKLVKDLEIVHVNSLKDLIQKINSNISGTINQNIKINTNTKYDVDFSEIKGQQKAKRAFEIVAAGNHNCILSGAPGVGKTLMAKRLMTIFPKLSYQEMIEITKINSIMGNIVKNGEIIKKRPFIEADPNITLSSFIGGGKNPKPGAISMANLGILFMDEFAEFDRKKLESLRLVLDQKSISINRINSSAIYPCNFVLVAAMNPCPCGYYGSKIHKCICSKRRINQYLSKISGPILDRIDIQINIENINYTELTTKKTEESSQTIRKRVEKARKVQYERFKKIKIFTNSEMNFKQIKKYCELEDEAKKLLEEIFKKENLNVRTYSNILKISRTIADLKQIEKIDISSLAEAVQYKLENKIYNKEV